MSMLALLLTICLAGGGTVINLAVEDELAIRRILHEQVAAWNRGDLAAFMQGYLEDDTLVFVGSKGPKYGWQAALDNYRQSYPNQAAMGALAFQLLLLRSTGANSAVVVGKWSLQGDEREPAAGHFLLVWQRIDDQWQIVADHSS